MGDHEVSPKRSALGFGRYLPESELVVPPF